MNFIVTRAASTQISGLFSGFNQSQNNSVAKLGYGLDESPTVMVGDNKYKKTGRK